MAATGMSTMAKVINTATMHYSTCIVKCTYSTCTVHTVHCTLTSMKLALMYSEPSSPVGLSLARDMLSDGGESVCEHCLDLILARANR